jgi:hypothetical protein
MGCNPTVDLRAVTCRKTIQQKEFFFRSFLDSSKLMAWLMPSDRSWKIWGTIPDYSAFA